MDIMVNELDRRDIKYGMYHNVQIQEDMSLLRSELQSLRVRILVSGGGAPDMKAADGEWKRRTWEFIIINTYGGQFNLISDLFQTKTSTFSTCTLI